MARVATYLRRSSSGLETADYSIPNQRERLAEWIAANGHTHAGEYAETGADSWQVDERKELSRLLADAKRQLFDLVAVWREDRLSKDSTDCGYILHQLRKQAGVGFISLLEPDISDDEATNDVMRDLRMFGYRKERETLKVKTTAGKRMRAKAGRLQAAAMPLYGYQWVDERDATGKTHRKAHYVIDDASIDGNPAHAPAAVVARIFRDYLQGGIALRALAARLTADGVPTPSMVLEHRGIRPRNVKLSSTWQRSTIQRLLSHPAYCGQHAAWRVQHTRVNVYDARSGKTVNRDRVIPRKNASETVPYDAHTCPPLVSVADWQAVQALLTRNKAESVRNARHPHAALLRNAFAYCGYCGRLMAVRPLRTHTDGTPIYGYYCRAGARPQHQERPCPGGYFVWPCAEVDAQTWAWVGEQMRHPDRLAKRLEQRRERDAALQARQHAKIADLEHLLAEAEQDAAGNDKAMLRAESDRDAAHYQALARQARDKADGYRERLDCERGVWSSIRSLSSLFDAWATRISAAYDRDTLAAASYDDKRALLREWGVRVEMRRQGSGDDALVFSMLPADVATAEAAADVSVPPDKSGGEITVYETFSVM